MTKTTFARALWVRIETIHAVTYFSQETRAAANFLGLDGFWAGYFGFRAAPLGCAGPNEVEDCFYNFAPSFVRRWVPDVWEKASPKALVEARSLAAAATLRRIAADVEAIAERAKGPLQDAIDRCEPSGLPMFAANLTVSLPFDYVSRLWQLCTSLREHRGDGHVVALRDVGIDGLQAHVLIATEQDNSPIDLQRTRGWTADDWNHAVERCNDAGLISVHGGLTAKGRALREEIESATDRHAARPFKSVDAEAREALLDLLSAVAIAVSQSGEIRYPNPMGLPRL